MILQYVLVCSHVCSERPVQATIRFPKQHCTLKRPKRLKIQGVQENGGEGAGAPLFERYMFGVFESTQYQVTPVLQSPDQEVPT